jgi:hypothetical protein
MKGKASESAGDRDTMMKSMMGMMSQCGEEGPGKMQSMMAKMKEGCSEAHASQMPEMMLKKMMPHCIEMMLPKIPAGKRGEAAAAVLSAIISNGSDGMSDEQRKDFLKTVQSVMNSST